MTNLSKNKYSGRLSESFQDLKGIDKRGAPNQ